MSRISPRRVTEHAHHLAGSQLALRYAKEAALVKEKFGVIPLSEYLWEATTNYRQEAYQSGFIQGLKKISLNPEGFGGYMIQDVAYCYSAKESIDIAANRAKDSDVKTFLQKRSDSYKSYCAELFKTWHIDNPACVSLSQSCKDYVNHEKNVATSYDSIYMIIALIPCAKLWPWLGQQIGAGEGNFGVYTDWVRINLNPDSSGVQKYEKIINDADKTGHITRDLALAVYKGSMKGEADFFSSISTMFL